jgi:8-oxo-dGTP diphosphatase
MIYRFLGKIWSRLPGFARWGMVRLSQPTFTVSAGAIVLNPRNEVLLLHHILRPGSGWGIPGGFLDRGEQPDEAVRREVLEETGIEISDVSLIRMQTLNRHIEFVYSARSDGDPRVLSREITELGWFRRESLPVGLPKAHRDLIEEVWRRGI